MPFTNLSLITYTHATVSFEGYGGHEKGIEFYNEINKDMNVD